MENRCKDIMLMVGIWEKIYYLCIFWKRHILTIYLRTLKNITGEFKNIENNILKMDIGNESIK